jgi:hypothetical protein
LAQWLATNAESFDFVYWNMLHEIEYFSISRLPQTVKSVLAAHLNTVSVPPQYEEEFSRIITFMRNGKSLDGSAMLDAMKQLDQRRNQNLAQVMPELASIIGYE